MQKSVASLLLFAAALVTAEEPDIKVQPKLCIVDQRTPSCDVTFQIAWSAPETGDYCVQSEKDDEPLRCWTEDRSGDLTDERDVAKTFHYELTTEAATVARAKVEVLRLDSEDRRRRRRTRHVWDVL